MDIYEIVIEGHLDHRRARYFEGLTIAPQANGRSVLSGPIPDQAALHGILARIRDMGVPLVLVRKVEPPSDGGN